MVTKVRGASFDAARYGAISAADYGVTADGTTDDGAAVAAALEALRDTAGDAILYFPPGNVDLTTPVSVDFGSATGRKRIMSIMGGTKFLVSGDNAIGITLTDAEYLECEGLGFEGTDSATGTAETAGLAFRRTSGVHPRSIRVRNCYFEHFKRQASTTIDSNDIRGGGCGLYVGPGTGVKVDGCEFIDSHQGLVARGAADITLRNCTFDTTYNYGADILVGGKASAKDCRFSSCGTLGASFSATVNSLTVPLGGILFVDADRASVTVNDCESDDCIATVVVVDAGSLVLQGNQIEPRNTDNDGDFTVVARRVASVYMAGNTWACPSSGTANYDLVSLGSTGQLTAISCSMVGNHVSPGGTIDHVLELDPGAARFATLHMVGNTIGDDQDTADWTITDTVQIVTGTLTGTIHDNTFIAGSGSAGCTITRILESSGGALAQLAAFRNREETVGSGAITNGINAAIAADYTITNVTTDRTMDADTAADAEIADVLGTLIADLAAIGITR